MLRRGPVCIKRHVRWLIIAEDTTDRYVIEDSLGLAVLVSNNVRKG